MLRLKGLSPVIKLRVIELQPTKQLHQLLTLPT